jgi:hypothetical protein
MILPEGQYLMEKLLGSKSIGSGCFIPEYSTDQYSATLEVDGNK